MIGRIYKALTPFYDTEKKRMSFKVRPALVLAQADEGDYIILPVSSITHAANIEPVYDVKIDPAVYPKLNLKKISYVRTHKQTVIHRTSLTEAIADLSFCYQSLYKEIIEKREQFSRQITNQACFYSEK